MRQHVGFALTRTGGFATLADAYIINRAALASLLSSRGSGSDEAKIGAGGQVVARAGRVVVTVCRASRQSRAGAVVLGPSSSLNS